MHISSKRRNELIRKGRKGLALFLAVVLAIQCANLPIIVSAATDGGEALATVEDTPTPEQTPAEQAAPVEESTPAPASVEESEPVETAPVETTPAATTELSEPAEPEQPAETNQTPANTTPVETEQSATTETPAPTTEQNAQADENGLGGGNLADNNSAVTAPAEDTTATVALALNQSTLAYEGTTYTSDQTQLEAPANQELKFTVAPTDGFEIDIVKQVAADGAETELAADVNGEYTIAADKVADGLKIDVATTEVPAEPTEEPADDATEEPATETPVEPGDESTTDEAEGVTTEEAPTAEESTEGEEATEEEPTPGEETASEATDEVTNTLSALAAPTAAGISGRAAALAGSGTFEDPYIIMLDQTMNTTEIGWSTGGRDHKYSEDTHFVDVDQRGNVTGVNAQSNGELSSSPSRVAHTWKTGYSIFSTNHTEYKFFKTASQVNTLIIDWDIDGVSDDTQKFFGNNLTFPTCTQAAAGKTFAGWKVQGDQSGTVYQPGDTYAFPGKNTSVTIVAQWNETLTVSPANVTIKVGETTQLTAAPAEWQNDIRWTSSDNDIATVDANGRVTAKAAGVATITAIADGKGPNSEALTATSRIYVQKSDIQTVQAYFYFALPGKSSTSTNVNDYMYAGDGTIAIPDGFDHTTNNSRWYNGDWHNDSRFNLDSYIVEPPSDAEIRKGLETYYNGQNGRDQYNPSWTYTIEWTTMVGNTDSVGYDYGRLDPYTVPHVDCRITVNTETSATLAYEVRQPDGSLVTNSTVHDKGDTVRLNSTVSTTGQFTTDGYQYDATKSANGITYQFDGWYTDSSYKTKAADAIDSVNESDVFYARYVAEKHTLTFDANSGQYSDQSTKKTAEYVYHDLVDLDAAEQPTRGENGEWEFVGWSTEKDGEVIDEYYMPNGDATLYAQWERTIHDGTKITVQVEKDGQHVAADGYVKATEYEAGGGTEGFTPTTNDKGNIEIAYTYTNLDCADITLEVAVPEGYDVEVESDKTGETEGLDGTKVSYKQEGSGANWNLDNVPGGATVTVKLTKKEFTVNYEAEDGGKVDVESEKVKYGESATGSIATPNEGYYFVNWTDAEGNEVSTDAKFAPQSVKENATYTAHFAKKMEVSITGKSAIDLVYDGSEQSVSGFVDETANGVPVNVDGQTYYVKDATSTASGINAMDEAEDTEISTDNLQVLDVDGKDVTGRFTVTGAR